MREGGNTKTVSLNLDEVVVAYVPVVHKGLINFFEGLRGIKILVFGEDLIAEYPQLEHDLRAVAPIDAVRMLISLGFSAEVVGRGFFSGLIAYNESVVFHLPSDEVMIDFAGRYLPNQDCRFHQVFTRWYKTNATSENEVTDNRRISHRDFDREIMIECLKAAELSSDWWRQVGSLAIRNGKVLSYGVNRHQPTDYSPYMDGDIRLCFGFGESVEICGAIHAEGAVIADAAKRGITLLGADLYVTTFPCPACARLIVAAGVRRVFYRDGYSVCDAIDILRSGRVEIIKVEFTQE